ncbi:hypothetical protein Agub_g3107 [Astrephomene gubernaculifera]|uniref:Uncharacterized protein n=1 Tax=Astrephomene gubernaculifera TaxID=47775 RepID=A0AAD3HIW2_9CHLO|nr:hypothetical protein Agub_g3107 [Astrephomene gubernaculifera]
MAYATPDHWETFYSTSTTGEDIDWLCQYSTLRKFVLHYIRQLEPPLPSILLLGPGLSTFAEDLYDRGYTTIVVVDSSAAAAEAHRRRAEQPPRHGLVVVQRDVSEPEWPEVDAQGLRFGIVVDKGLIDCLLTARDGMDRAARAISNVWARMATPGVWLSVSHSPPADRRDLYTQAAAVEAGASSVYWHDFQVKRVLLPALEYSATTAVPGAEVLQDINLSDLAPKPGEGDELRRLMQQGQGQQGQEQQQQPPKQPQLLEYQPAARYQARVLEGLREAGGGRHEAAADEDPMADFRDDVAYIYFMIK